MEPQISIIVALAKNNAIGKNGDLLCYISADLKRFKQLTTGNAIIMGRKTFESLPNGALPNRRNIVISRNTSLKLNNAEVVHSIEDAIELCKKEEKIYIIGGGDIYKQSLKLANELNLTLIHKEFDDADTFFPEIDFSKWQEVNREDVDNDEKCDFAYSFVDYVLK